jgi:hypothetical protein
MGPALAAERAHGSIGVRPAHAAPRELGLDAPPKLATSLAAEKTAAFGDME